jgi:hypothetical protein
MASVKKHQSAHEGMAAMVGALLCVFMHDSPMWPIHGQYQCRTCGRHYPVPWAGDDIAPAPELGLAVGSRHSAA